MWPLRSAERSRQRSASARTSSPEAAACSAAAVRASADAHSRVCASRARSCFSPAKAQQSQRVRARRSAAGRQEKRSRLLSPTPRERRLCAPLRLPFELPLSSQTASSAAGGGREQLSGALESATARFFPATPQAQAQRAYAPRALGRVHREQAAPGVTVCSSPLRLCGHIPQRQNACGGASSVAARPRARTAAVAVGGWQ